MINQAILLGLMNAVEGEEAEFNRWYDEQHLDDVLAIPGMISARRFHVVENPDNPDATPWRYLTIYEVEPDAIATIPAELRRRIGEKIIPISEALASERVGWFFHQIAERNASGHS